MKLESAPSIRNRFSTDHHRPIFHYQPPANWMNDPNGLIQWRGQYHLFYQHNPREAVWGDIHWGHAVSEDLLHWRDLPLALAPTPNSPDERGVWSGCVVDQDGVATAIYTGVRGDDHAQQTVCIATSTDDALIHWEKSSHNPVLHQPPSEFAGCGFRDPFVWREKDIWFMVIGAGQPDGPEAVLLYRSHDLLTWEYLAPLLVNEGAQNDYVYECPTFFPLEDRWVLLVSVMPEARVEYFIGFRWKNHFVPEQHGILAESPFYAAATFADQWGRRLLFGWLKEARTEMQRRTAGYAGALSAPMELRLLEGESLAMTPASEILSDEWAGEYEQRINVSVEEWVALLAQPEERRLKLVISDDVSKVVFVDGTIVEIFDYPGYRALRIEEEPLSAAQWAAWLPFPLKRVGIWQMPKLW